MRFSRLGLGAAAALALGVSIGAPTGAEASERWRYEQLRGGGAAVSCDRFGNQTICATIYCSGRGDRLSVGLVGWEPPRRVERRDGVIIVDGQGRNVQFVIEDDSVIGDVWRIDLDRRGVRDLVNRLEAGSLFSADLAPRRPAFEFTLRGSRNAISRLEDRCAQVAGRDDNGGGRRDDDNRDRAPANAESDRWRFERVRGGGYARSCGEFGNQTVCATIYCSGESARLSAGLTGWEPRRRSARRQGSIDVDGRARNVELQLENDAAIGAVWRFDLNRRNVRSLVERLESGRRFTVAIDGRQRAFGFTLRGSRQALNRLEERCARLANRDDERNESARRRENNDDDDDRRNEERRERRDERPELRGGDWVELATFDVSTAQDRDVVDLDNSDGRFQALRLRARINDVRVRFVNVRYDDGEIDRVAEDGRLNRGETSGVFYLDGPRGRHIDEIILVYETVGDGPRAEIEVFGYRR